jgi:hypothetical protein
MFRDKPYDKLSLVKLNAAVDLETPVTGQEEARVLLRYDNGKPAVVSQQHGNGEVILVTTNWTPAWSDWATTFGHMHLPFLTETLKHLLKGQLDLHNRPAGNELVWYPPQIDQALKHQLLTPSGKELELAPARTEGQRTRVTTDPIGSAGIYRIAPIRPITSDEAKKASETLYAVTPDLRESEDLTTIDDQQIDEQVGFSAVHVTAGDDLTVETVSRTSGEWWWYLLLVVIAVVGCETLLAWVCSRAW